MKRSILTDLQKWKNSDLRKPLIIRGARQVGKTWILKEFGKTFENGYAYFNFDKDEEYKQFFQTTKDVKRILNNLSLLSGQAIDKNTLIIFDEIQSCPEALNALKYFQEDAPEYYVACAGSLLGIVLSSGFPVGKVDFLEMGPMTFSEYLSAVGYDNYSEYLFSIDSVQSIPDAFFNPLVEELKKYFIIGGMPEAVNVWSMKNDIKEVDGILSNILTSYESDFGKHAPITDVPKISLIWASLPSQLARENKKYLFSAVKTGARAREYENALNRLKNAGLVHKVNKITKPGLPLSAYDDLDSFKIYMNDVGLLRRHSYLDYGVFSQSTRLFTEFKGSLTENFVYQSLINRFEVKPRYWATSPYEVDFIIQSKNDIIPVECKAGANVKSTSLKKYISSFDTETPIAVRYSLRNLSFDGKILNIPLFMIDFTEKLINIVR